MMTAMTYKATRIHIPIVRRLTDLSAVRRLSWSGFGWTNLNVGHVERPGGPVWCKRVFDDGDFLNIPRSDVKTDVDWEFLDMVELSSQSKQLFLGGC